MELIKNMIALLQTHSIQTALLHSLGLTVVITFFAVIIGSVLGVGIFAMKRCKITVVNIIADIYIFIFRGVPLILLLIISVMALKKLDTYVVVLILGVIASANIAKLLDKAFEQVDISQYYSARSLGMTKSNAFFRVVLPQALKCSREDYRDAVVGTLQWTTCLGFFGIVEFTYSIGRIGRSAEECIGFALIGILVYFLIELIIFGLFAPSNKNRGCSDK